MAESTPEKIVELVRHSAGAQVDAAMKLEHRAVAGLRRAAKSTRTLAKDNPVATAGVMLGAGVLLGAIAHRVLAPKPTVRDTMMDALRASAKRVSKKLT